EVLEGDLREQAACARAVESVDYVLHQAALGSVPRSVQDPRTTHEVNATGTLNMLLAARSANVRRFVFASSSSVYGNTPTLPKEETMPSHPISPYAVSKLAAERYLLSFNFIYGMETVALRYFNVFGPKQDPDSQYAAVIPRFIMALASGKAPVIYGDGEQSRDFTFVENVVQANLRACVAPEAPGNVMNIACGERYSLNLLVKCLYEIMGKHVPAIYEPERSGDVKHSMAAIERARQLLSFSPQVKFQEGLLKTVAWYLAEKA
ncbi:MAG: NAD-dependent epimerase/dehydratase family protein, partial [candidate division KSB1 bacterium]